MAQTQRNLNDCLRVVLRGRVCVVGLGNRQRRDDGAGPRLVDARDPSATGTWLDVGVSPENYLEPIVRSKPDTVLMVDAASFGGQPGECRLLKAASFETLAVSTHASSLSILAEYLTRRTGAQVCVIAIQSQTVDAGDSLSAPVERAVSGLAALLSRLLDPSPDPRSAALQAKACSKRLEPERASRSRSRTQTPGEDGAR